MKKMGTRNMLRVAMNAVPLLSPLTGIGQYTKALLTEFGACDFVETNNFYATGWSQGIRDNPIPVQATRLKSVIRRCLPNSYSIARFIQQQSFSQGMKAFKPDLYHEPNFLAFKTDVPTIVTVHDLSWVHHPEMHPVERVAAMNRYFENGLSRAVRIITDSEFVRREVIDVFGLHKDHVRSIALGVESIFRPMHSEETNAMLLPRGLTHGKYWLAVGTLEPRKNLMLVLEAFLCLPVAYRKKYPLVIVGMRGWKSSNLEAKMRPLIASGEVRQLGYLSRADLATVIAGAKALIYPSVYEGFGLPPLEAMSCGVPVIASNVSSLPEVVGDAGILIPPDNVDLLMTTMVHLMSDPIFSADLVQKGLERSRLFSWSRCAEETISLYRTVLS